MKKYWLVLAAVAMISSCSSGGNVSHKMSDLNKVVAHKDATYQKSLDFLGSRGIMVTEFPPKVLISMPADTIFKPDTAILYSDAMDVVRSLAVLISKYDHHAIYITTNAIVSHQDYMAYTVSHNQGEKLVKLLTDYGDYSFIGFNTKLIMEDDIFNSYYASGKYFIDIELSES